MILLLLGIALFGFAVYMGLEAMTVRQKQVAVSLRRARRYGGTSLRETELGRGVNDRVVGPALQHLADIAQKLPMTASLDELARRLVAAGWSRRFTPTSFLSFKGSLACIGVAFGLLIMLKNGDPAQGLLIALAGGAVLFFLPDYLLVVRTRRRREEMRLQLPEVLDLLCVSVEAGLGFDSALAKINERSEGPLIEELAFVLHEMRIGEGRSQALKNLAERVELPELTSFTRAIIQADQLGMSLGRILRVQSQDMRNKRQMDAEAKAMKAPIKMLFPTVIFIFPAMFIVVLGPAMMTLGEIFSAA